MTPEHHSPYQLITQYRSLFLRHAPPRFARMLPQDEAERLKEKYHDTDGQLTDEMLVQQLSGKESFAVPWEANGLAHLLPLDVDSGGLPAIQVLLEECRRRGLWAFGQYTPKKGLPDEQQHGYVFVPFGDLVNVSRIQKLGEELLRRVEGRDWKIENRAHKADTRLPMTYHQVNRTWGELVLPDKVLPIGPSPYAALKLLFESYHENATNLLPPPPEPRQREQREGRIHSIDIARFNEGHDLKELLAYYGAKRVGRGLHLCPFHDDQRASLGIYTRNGQTFCHCLSRNSDCPLSIRGRNDAFNVYCIGEPFPNTPLTTEEALRKINERDRSL